MADISFIQSFILPYRALSALISEWKATIGAALAVVMLGLSSLCQSIDCLRQGLHNNYNYGSTLKVRANQSPNCANYDIAVQEWVWQKKRYTYTGKLRVVIRNLIEGRINQAFHISFFKCCIYNKSEFGSEVMLFKIGQGWSMSDNDKPIAQS